MELSTCRREDGFRFGNFVGLLVIYLILRGNVQGAEDVQYEVKDRCCENIRVHYNQRVVYEILNIRHEELRTGLNCRQRVCPSQFPAFYRVMYLGGLPGTSVSFAVCSGSSGDDILSNNTRRKRSHTNNVWPMKFQTESLPVTDVKDEPDTTTETETSFLHTMKQFNGEEMTKVNGTSGQRERRRGNLRSSTLSGTIFEIPNPRPRVVYTLTGTCFCLIVSSPPQDEDIVERAATRRINRRHASRKHPTTTQPRTKENILQSLYDSNSVTAATGRGHIRKRDNNTANNSSNKTNKSSSGNSSRGSNNNNKDTILSSGEMYINAVSRKRYEYTKAINIVGNSKEGQSAEGNVNSKPNYLQTSPALGSTDNQNIKIKLKRRAIDQSREDQPVRANFNLKDQHPGEELSQSYSAGNQLTLPSRRHQGSLLNSFLGSLLGTPHLTSTPRPSFQWTIPSVFMQSSARSEVLNTLINDIDTTEAGTKAPSTLSHDEVFTNSPSSSNSKNDGDENKDNNSHKNNNNNDNEGDYVSSNKAIRHEIRMPPSSPPWITNADDLNTDSTVDEDDESTDKNDDFEENNNNDRYKDRLVVFASFSHDVHFIGSIAMTVSVASSCRSNTPLQPEDSNTSDGSSPGTGSNKNSTSEATTATSTAKSTHKSENITTEGSEDTHHPNQTDLEEESDEKDDESNSVIIWQASLGGTLGILLLLLLALIVVVVRQNRKIRENYHFIAQEVESRNHNSLQREASPLTTVPNSNNHIATTTITVNNSNTDNDNHIVVRRAAPVAIPRTIQAIPRNRPTGSNNLASIANINVGSIYPMHIRLHSLSAAAEAARLRGSAALRILNHNDDRSSNSSSNNNNHDNIGSEVVQYNGGYSGDAMVAIDNIESTSSDIAAVVIGNTRSVTPPALPSSRGARRREFDLGEFALYRNDIVLKLRGLGRRTDRRRAIKREKGQTYDNMEFERSDSCYYGGGETEI